MTTPVMNADACDLAHEALKLEEYGRDAPHAGGELHAAAGEKPAATRDEEAKNPELATDPDIALLTAPEEVDDIIGPLRAASFPSCP